MSQQQTVLRVQTNIPDTTISGNTATQYDFLDLYSDIPIKISKSFAELQDIATKNSDYSIGLSLPGSKKNNRFFESFFNVDTQSLYFNASKRVECQVLLNDQAYFRGYLRLNKVSVLNSLVEYDVTLYSTVGNLFGNIGNNLLKDLNFNDPDYFFNHIFNTNAVGNSFRNTNFSIDGEEPYPYIYPIVHNGYEYSGTTVTFSGATSGSTRFYTSTSPISGFTSLASAYAAGVEQFYINSPGQGLINNQLKPALNIWSLIKLIFKTYGYSIKSDFMNTPWMKTLYMYGYFSSEATKFGFKITNIQELPHEGVEIITYIDTPTSTLNTVVCKLGTGIPCFCLDDISYSIVYTSSTVNGTIVAGTSGNTVSYTSGYVRTTSPDVAVADPSTLKYRPRPIGEAAVYEDGQFVDFGLVIDQNIKQIDLLSSIAKKYNLVFIPDSDIPNQLIIEPFDFYMGTGQIYDWTPKLSYDKGWSVEPALNFIESTLLLTDKEDQDEGNREFKARNNRIYGQNNIYNPTDFKSQNKTIDTIFSPELIRKWDKDDVNNISLPLGINYAASSAENVSGTTNTVTWSYKGVKTQPKLMYWLGAFNPFLDQTGEVYNNGAFNTYSAYLSNSSATSYSQYYTIPAISHTMPMGLEDSRKINNDSLSILFNSELPTNIGVQTFNTYTENDVYNKFYRNRITNLYDPNTRFLSGFFDLKYSDVQNLNGNDLIKINEQLFLVNKLNDYNLTNRELTSVELVQFNTTPQKYTDRYFRYSYTDRSNCFKFKTDFTNPNLLDTNFGWSVYYDHQLGSITNTGATSFTSSFLDIQNGLPKYVGYTITEITKEEYDTSSCRDWTCDSLHNYIYSLPNGPFDSSMPTYWTNSGATINGVNLFVNATDFTSSALTYGILVGSSTYYGIIGGNCLYTDCFDIGTGSSFNIGFNDEIDTWSVDEIIFQTDGKIICAGLFTRYRGETGQSGIIRLNIDGSRDTSFNTGTGFSGGQVFGLTSQLDGKILCVGNFTSYNGITADGIIRLNTDGSRDTSFVTGTGFSGNTGPYSVALQASGKILVSGNFLTYNGTSVDKLVRLNTNGTLDNTFISTQPSGEIYSMVVQSDGKVILGGQCGVIYSGTYITVNFIYRINNDGSYDSTFSGGGTRFDNAVRYVNIQPDGKYIAVGDFTTYNGLTSRAIIRLNTDGSVDSGFNVGTGFSGSTLPDVIYQSDLQPDGKILIVGGFDIYNGTTIGNGICRINTNGSLDTSFNTGQGFVLGFSSSIPGRAIRYYNYNDRIFAGATSKYYGTTGLTINNIVKLKMDGSEDICP